MADPAQYKTYRISVDANVRSIVNDINTGTLVPFADFGEPVVYYFQTMSNGLGSIVYTVFDKNTTLGLDSYLVSYGAATTIRQILFEPFPKNKIELRFVILPEIPAESIPNTTTIIVGDDSVIIPSAAPNA